MNTLVLLRGKKTLCCDIIIISGRNFVMLLVVIAVPYVVSGRMKFT